MHHHTLPGHLLAHARERGDSVALHVVSDGTTTTLTWAQLAQQSAAYAETFRAAGVVPGSVVAICLKHGPSLHPAFLGAMLAGAVPTFLPFPTPKQDPRLYWESHRVLFGTVTPAAVLTYAENVADLTAILPATTPVLTDEPPASVPVAVPVVGLDALEARFPLPQPDAIALLQHSSGTTGHKKGVILTHRQVVDQVSAYSAVLGTSSESTIASWLPLYHDMGLVTAFLAPLCVGSTVVSLDPFAWAEDPHSLLRAVDEYDAQFVWMPNFGFNHLVRTKEATETYQLDRVRAFINCSEPCRPETFASFVDAFAAHGVRPEQLQVCYAMAETVFAVSQTPVGRAPRISMIDGRAQLSNGPVLPGLEVRVDPQAGGDVGELEVRGSYVSAGYYRNAEATTAAFDEDWYRTGDLGSVLDGEVYVLGRTKEVIIHHGVNYYAHDLEAAAMTVPGVKAGRVVALAVYDPASASEQVELVAELDPEGRQENGPENTHDGVLIAAIKEAVSDRYNLALAKVHLVDAGWLVKTTSGKVSRAENLTKLLARETPDPEASEAIGSPAQDLAGVVLDTVATTFDVQPSTLGSATTAADVPGWDSLGHTVLMIRLGRALGCAVPESVAARARNIGELTDQLAKHLEER